MNKSIVIFLLFISALPLAANAEIAIDTKNLELRFSEFGDLNSVRSCLPACSDPDAKAQEFDSYRGFVSLNRDSGVIFNRHRIDNDQSVQLIFTNNFTNEIRSWKIPHSGWLIGLEVSRSQNMAMTTGGTFEPPHLSGFGAWLETPRYVVIEQNRVNQSGLDETFASLPLERNWTGYRNRFWTAMVKPEVPVNIEFRTSESQAEAQLDIIPADPGPARFLFYIGPVELSALQSAHPQLERLMYSGLWFWLRWVCQVFFHLLTAIHSVVPFWAPAIILLSVIVHLLMLPINRFAERLQDDVHQTESRIAPQLNRIKKESKGAEQAEKIMALYKDEGVHPLYSLKSLLGVLLIIPVFVGAFNMLSENIWLAGESFLWIKDLSLPDAVASLPFELPFFGNQLNILPFIMIALSVPASILRVASQADSAVKAKNTRNLILMSLIFFLLFYTFPAGMVLYWVINNAISLATAVLKRISL